MRCQGRFGESCGVVVGSLFVAAGGWWRRCLIGRGLGGPGGKPNKISAAGPQPLAVSWTAGPFTARGLAVFLLGFG